MRITLIPIHFIFICIKPCNKKTPELSTSPATCLIVVITAGGTVVVVVQTTGMLMVRAIKNQHCLYDKGKAVL